MTRRRPTYDDPDDWPPYPAVFDHGTPRVDHVPGQVDLLDLVGPSGDYMTDPDADRDEDPDAAYALAGWAPRWRWYGRPVEVRLLHTDGRPVL